MESRRGAPGSWQLPAVLALAFACGCASDPRNGVYRDRLEPLNRPVFGLNQRVDDYALGPVARGWIRITPQAVRDAITDAYHNLTFPDRFVASLGEGRPLVAGSELLRFVLNSTLGMAGLLDPATEAGLAKHDEDVGKMLARWGVPAGPYVMIPFVGPSTPRDVAGGVVDMTLNPLTWTGFIGMGAGALFAVNGRAQDERQIETAKRAAIDYYVLVRDAYLQERVEPFERELGDALYGGSSARPPPWAESAGPSTSSESPAAF